MVTGSVLETARQGEVGSADAVSDDDRADELFHALADATRRDIVRRTMLAEHSVSALARNYPMSFAAVQKHVVVLARAGLVTKEPRGREQVVRCDIDAVRTAQRLLDRLEQVWRDRLDRMGDLLAEPEPPVPHTGPITTTKTEQEQ